jgi:hypothetical protein
MHYKQKGKSVAAEKKLHKSVENRIEEDICISPEFSSSPFGPLTSKVSRRTFCYLISTLNAAYPDYDFRFVCFYLELNCFSTTYASSISSVRVEDFIRQPSLENVVSSVNTSLQNVGKEYVINQLKLWETFEDQIKMHECDIYSYLPDEKGDPFSDQNCIWSCNYFFFNKTKKQILFFSLHSVRYAFVPMLLSCS